MNNKLLNKNAFRKAFKPWSSTWGKNDGQALVPTPSYDYWVDESLDYFIDENGDRFIFPE